MSNIKNVKNKVKDNESIVVISIFSVIIISIVLFVTSSLSDSSNPEKKPGGNDKIPVDTAILANDILLKTGMDSFVANYYMDTTSVEFDKNLIDLSSCEFMSDYFVGNDSIERYVIVYDNPHNIDMVYVKYEDFMKLSKEIFNGEPAYDYKSTAMTFPDLTKTDDGKYKTTLNGAGVCNLSSDADNCYVLIASIRVLDRTAAEFSDLKMNGNVITGMVKKYYDVTDKETFIDGPFEFVFDELDGRYIAKSFKITNPLTQ